MPELALPALLAKVGVVHRGAIGLGQGSRAYGCALAGELVELRDRGADLGVTVGEAVGEAPDAPGGQLEEVAKVAWVAGPSSKIAKLLVTTQRNPSRIV